MTTWITLGLWGETLLLLGAGLVWLRGRGYTLAEAFICAVVGLFMVVSLVHQVCCWAGLPAAAFGVEGMLVATAGATIRRWWPRLAGDLAAAGHLLNKERLPAAILLVAWTAMAILMVVDRAVPEGAAVGLQAMASDQAAGLLNTAGLFFHTGRFGLAPQACGFGLLAHMAIAFGTYTLARRYAWPPMALTVALVVVAMPRLVALGMHPDGELITTSATVLALVLTVRLVEQHRPFDLGLLVLVLLFSLDDHLASLVRLPILAGLAVVVVVRRHGWLQLREMVAVRLWAVLTLLFPAVIFAQIPAMVHNGLHAHPLLGPHVGVDPVPPAAAAGHFLGYLFICLDLTEPIRQMVLWLVGLDLHRPLAMAWGWMQHLLPMGTDSKAHLVPPFSGAGGMGFGPFAALLVLPALVHALWRGPRRLKALAIAWIAYLYAAALMIRWQPGMHAILTPFLSASGFLVAFSLPPWRLRRRGLRMLQIGAALLLAWSIGAGSTPV